MRALATLLLLMSLSGWALALPEVAVETLVKGQGEPVKVGDKVAIRYQLTLASGELVDSTPADSTYDFEIGSANVIPGMSQGLVGMKPGETRRVTIPPELGYGAADQGKIPPNSTLIFKIELLYPLDRAHLDDHDHDHDHDHDQDQENRDFGEDGSLNRPRADTMQSPAMGEYLMRDFFTRPWRRNDAPRILWKSNAVLTLLVLAVGLVGYFRESGARSS